MHSKDGERYVENPDHVPAPADLYGTLSTQPWGSTKLEDISTAVQADKVAVAEQVLGALDPDDHSVDASAVLLPDGESNKQDPDVAADALRERAQATVDAGVQYPGQANAEDAAKDGDEGEAAAAGADGSVSDGNLADNSNAGEDAAKTSKPAAKKAAPAKKATAKKAAAK